MKRTHTPLVIGNWKMNPKTASEAQHLTKQIVAMAKKAKGTVDVFVAPPFPFLHIVQKTIGTSTLNMAAQDMHPEPLGAFTGSVSAPMLKDCGVTAVIIGHSERRKAGMTDAQVQALIAVALKQRLLPVVCIGEHERDQRGDFYGVVERQLTLAVAGLTERQLSQLVIAYEPVWAIGTGKNATPEDVEEMRLYILKVVSNRFSRSAAGKVRILYGGSVNSKNVEALHSVARVDGFLVGGASLDPREFEVIISTVRT
jgi:triosephosphate isomerase